MQEKMLKENLKIHLNRYRMINDTVDILDAKLVNIAIDFDGVIHRNSKGFYDGTVYDEPIEGAYEALESLSKKYTLIVCTVKAKSDRGLINGRTGTELVWEWLKKHNMDQFVSKVTAEKPRAVAYIDDKSVIFDGNWDSCFDSLQGKDLI